MSETEIGRLMFCQSAEGIDVYPEARDPIRLAERFCAFLRMLNRPLAETGVEIGKPNPEEQSVEWQVADFHCQSDCTGHFQVMFQSSGRVHLALDAGLDWDRLARSFRVFLDRPDAILCACGSHGENATMIEQ